MELLYESTIDASPKVFDVSTCTSYSTASPNGSVAVKLSVGVVDTPVAVSAGEFNTVVGGLDPGEGLALGDTLGLALVEADGDAESHVNTITPFNPLPPARVVALFLPAPPPAPPGATPTEPLAFLAPPVPPLPPPFTPVAPVRDVAFAPVFALPAAAPPPPPPLAPFWLFPLPPAYE